MPRNVIIKCTTSVCHTRVLFLHKRKELGIKQKPGFALTALGVELSTPKLLPKTRELPWVKEWLSTKRLWLKDCSQGYTGKGRDAPIPGQSINSGSPDL